ncbi:A/G-specific adenine glycosylase [Acidicapsa ligni]|uniref:A/G-specific adenine glycosylase n=1 Tax=Acidicapsa ligni TaxID=542300 RepID=UPI0021DF506D|nr:A/G-specific adenine glycosylase [Acidicapsa ligni]
MAQLPFNILDQDSDSASGTLHELRRCLLAWYGHNRRDLPWRRTADPYAVWVSEIMLQQTRVAAVLPRYEDFMRNFPSVESLANAAEADVLALWSGLGYYRRARMLHKAAKVVAFEYRGVMPLVAAELRALPGIGAYTSAAIASIAFGEAVAVVDGNVERVVQRLAGWGSESASGQAKLARDVELMANRILDPGRPGDFNQAMMELGATVCLPRNPNCLLCPLEGFCQTRGEHPTRPRAKMRSQDAAYALVVRTGSKGREVLLDQRSDDQSVMPGMWELPGMRDLARPNADVRLSVRHAIMQVNYYVRIHTVFEEDVDEVILPAGRRCWVPLKQLGTLPLTGLARKVLLRAKLAELATVAEVADA